MRANLRAYIALAMGASASLSMAGSIFLTGHDPDFHALHGGNSVGARNINTVAIGFVQDVAFNTYAAGGINKFLFVESNIAIPGGHTRGKNGIALDYTEGTDFDHHDASTLNAALDQLGTTYSAIVVASDFGGTLTQAELDILNTRASDIHTFLNSGGGIYTMAQGNGGAGLTPGGGHYGFIPNIVTSVPSDQTEAGYTVTAYGAAIGLTDSDINGNFSHNVFDSTGGLNVVDIDAQGRYLSLASHTLIVPEPGTMAAIGMGIAFAVRRRRKS